MTELKPRRLIRWECPICEKMYSTKEDCQECLNRGFNHVVQVGDIVLLGYTTDGVSRPIYQYGWMDGDPDWVYAKAKCDSMPDGFKYAFFYVVTMIKKDRQDPHRPRIHLCTKALAKQGNGYTYYDTATPEDERGHMAAIPMEDPPEVIVTGSKDLIGTETPGLI